MKRAWDLGGRRFIEIGPDTTLTAMGKSITSSIKTHTSVEQGSDYWHSSLDNALVEDVETTCSGSRLYNGADEYQTNITKRYPIQAHGQQMHRLLQQIQREDYSSLTVYNSYLHAGLIQDWLGDHVLHNEIVLPGAAMIDLIGAAGLRCRHYLVDTAAGWHNNECVVHITGLRIIKPVVVVDVRTDKNNGNNKDLGY